MPSGPGTISPGAVPTGSSATAPSGTIACLRLAALRPAGASFTGEALTNRSRIAAIFAFHLLVERQLPPGELPDDLGGQVVGGRAESAGRDDQVEADAVHVPQPVEDVVGMVGDDQDLRQLDSDRGQLLGKPGTVLVDDGGGEDFGTGYEHAGPHRFALFSAVGTVPTLPSGEGRCQASSGAERVEHRLGGLAGSDRVDFIGVAEVLALAEDSRQVGRGDQYLARLRPFVTGDHAAAFEHVDQAAGAGVSDPQTALDHRYGSGLGVDHELDRFVEQVVLVGIEVAVGRLPP